MREKLNIVTILTRGEVPRHHARVSKIAIYIGKRKNRLNVCDFSRTIDFLIPRLQLNV